MKVTIDLISASSAQALPSKESFQAWADITMNALATELSLERDIYELSLRLVDADESAFLNENFRNKQGPTNILSFPYTAISPSEPDIHLLGDLAICAPVVLREAQEQNKSPEAHWAHMTVHGILHLNAYDHENSIDAQIMESLEITIMAKLGFANPYR